MVTWEEIDKKLNLKIKQIFKHKPIHTMSSYERRKTIFEYLCNNVTYDHELLQDIELAKYFNEKLSRNPTTELMSVVDKQHGICNAISQYYKLLLEKVGVKSYCVICDDQTEINHQLSLVYNDETNTYSFDDVTSVIVERGTQDEFFDYDVEQARKLGQGTRILLTHQYFTFLTEEYIDYVVKRKQHPYETINGLPTNIEKVKPSGKKH